MSTKVDWKDASEEWPKEPGNYLTFWSDGALETFRFYEQEIEEGQIILGDAKLLFWADNVQPPELKG